MKIETELRNARREIKRLSSELRKSEESERRYLTRAINAENDRDEWRKRFDILLSKCVPMTAEADRGNGNPG